MKTKFILILILHANLVHAQSATLSFDSLRGSPQASLNDISWISGYWRGEAFGGTTEEFWSPPLGNSMMCAFKLVVDNKVKFYEIVAITELDETLLLQLKHFHGDLKGWEEKNVTQDFRLVRIEHDKVWFEGFTFEKVSDEEMNIYVMIRPKDGPTEEVKFNYRKAKI